MAETPKEAVVTLLGDHYGLYGRAIPPETDLFRDLGSDPVDALEVLMTLEECFGVYFDQEAIQRVRTVADVVSLVEHSLQPKAT